MARANQPIPVNGALGEGGGALFRTALSLSCLTLQPIRIVNIRGALRRKGLQAEDMLFLQGVQAICDATVTSDSLESDVLEFEPKALMKPVDINLHASELGEGKVPVNVVVVAQGLITLLARAGGYSRLKLFGETHNRNTLTFDAFEKSSVHVLRQQGIYCFPTVERSGFGYGTVGQIECEIEPSSISGLMWHERGIHVKGGITLTSTDFAPHKIQDALSESAKLVESLGLNGTVVHQELRGSEPGLAVALWTHYERGCFCVSDVLAKGESPVEMLSRAKAKLTGWLSSDATLDPFLSDQILLAACLSDQPTQFTTAEVTRRLTTMATIIKQFMPISLSIKGREGQPGVVSIRK